MKTPSEKCSGFEWCAMAAIRALSVIGIIAMAIAIVGAILTGDFFEEGSAIWALPWGKVTLIDLYVGLGLFVVWVWYRESSPAKAIAWSVGLVVLGNLAAAAYVMVAAFSAQSITEMLTGDTR